MVVAGCGWAIHVGVAEEWNYADIAKECALAFTGPQ